MRKYYLLTARLARNAQDAQDKQLKNPAHDLRFADELGPPLYYSVPGYKVILRRRYPP